MALTDILDSLIYLTREDAAQLLRVSTATVDRYARDGRLTKYVTPGGSPRFAKLDVLGLITVVVGSGGRDGSVGAEEDTPVVQAVVRKNGRRDGFRRPTAAELRDMDPMKGS